MTTSREFWTAARAAIGADLNEAAFKAAAAKVKRHMRAKYGTPLDYSEEMSESGTSNAVYFYRECVTKPNAPDTFNRHMQAQRRQG